MNIKNSIASGITIVGLLAVSALPAFASNQKAPLYGPVDPFVNCSTGGSPTDSTFGFVNINPQNGNLQIEVAVKNGTPNETYDIYVNQDPGGCPTTPIAQKLITNAKGNGNLHIDAAQIAGATNYWLSAVGETGGDVLRSPAVQ